MHGPARYVATLILLIVLALGNPLLSSASVACGDCEHCRSRSQSSQRSQTQTFGTISLQRYMYHPPAGAKDAARCISCQTASQASLHDLCVTGRGAEDERPIVLASVVQIPSTLISRLSRQPCRWEEVQNTLRTVILLC